MQYDKDQLQKVVKRAANYMQLKAEIIGTIRAAETFLNGVSEEDIQKYKAYRDAASDLESFRKLEKIIERLEN